MRSNTGGTGGGGVLIPPADVTNIKAGIGNSVIKFSWTDPQDITAEGVVVNEWAGSVIVVNKDHKPADQKDGDVIYTSTTRNQHQTEPYIAEGLDVGSKYFFAIFPFSVYGTYNIDQSQTGEVTVIASPEVKPLNEYTWDEIKTIANMGDVSSDGNEWKIGEQVYFRLKDQTAPVQMNVRIKPLGSFKQVQVPFEIAGFKHDTITGTSTKAAISFTSVTTIGSSARPSEEDYRNSEMKALIEEAYNNLSADLKAVIVPVDKATWVPVYNSTNFTKISLSSRLWGLSTKEINTKEQYNYPKEGATYPIFTDDKSRIRKNPEKKVVEHLTRSTNWASTIHGDGYGYIGINTIGSDYNYLRSSYDSDLTEFVCGFCIGGQ